MQPQKSTNIFLDHILLWNPIVGSLLRSLDWRPAIVVLDNFKMWSSVLTNRSWLQHSTTYSLTSSLLITSRNSRLIRETAIFAMSVVSQWLMMVPSLSVPYRDALLPSLARCPNRCLCLWVCEGGGKWKARAILGLTTRSGWVIFNIRAQRAQTKGQNKQFTHILSAFGYLAKQPESNLNTTFIYTT